MLAEAAVTSRLEINQLPSSLDRGVVRRLNSLQPVGSEGLSDLQAVEWELPLVPCHKVLGTRQLTMSAWFIRGSQQADKSYSKTKAPVFYSLLSEVTSITSVYSDH